MGCRMAMNMKNNRYLSVGLLLVLTGILLFCIDRRDRFRVQESKKDAAAAATVAAEHTPEQTAFEEYEEDFYSGWDFNQKTLCLTITGTGDIYRKDIPCPNSRENWKWEFGGPDYLAKVKSVIIEPGITCINEGAFGDFKSLESIVIPNTVTKIEDYAFYDCKALKQITVPDSVTAIGKECFWGCRSLEQFHIGKCVETIGQGAFFRCDKLVDISLDENNGNLEIKSGVLYQTRDKILYLCLPTKEKKRKIVIEEGTKDISALAFARKDMVTEIIIPASVEVIGGGAFYRCKNLEELVFPKDSKCRYIQTYAYYSDGYSEVFGAFQGCKCLKEIHLPDSVEYIGYSIHGHSFGGTTAFDGCQSLQRIHFGKAFRGYTSVVDPYWKELCAKNKKIKKDDIFTNICYRCPSLREFTVSGKNKYFSAKNGILYNKQQTGVCYYPGGKEGDVFVVPNGVTELQQVAFWRHQFLKHIVLPQSLEHIQPGAFFQCKSLAEISWSGKSNLKTIGARAFSGCTGLKQLSLSGQGTVIQQDAFYHCVSLERVTLGRGIKRVGKYAFWSCDSLKRVILGSEVRRIREHAFYSCKQLKQITIPETVKTIEYSAFGIYAKSKKHKGGAVTIKSEKVEGFTVYGRKGAAAEKYARKNHFLFIAI